MTTMSRVCAVLGAAAALIPSSSAMAAGSGADVYACQFAAIARNINPGVYSVQHVLTAAEGLQVPPDHGTFDFSTYGAPMPSVCAGARVNSDLGAGSAVATISMYGSGTYDDFVCMPTIMQGTVTAGPDYAFLPPTTVGTPPPLYFSTPFTFLTAGGNGMLWVFGGSNGEGSGGAGAGYVNVVPDVTSPAGGDCVSRDAYQLRVMGAFTLVIPVNP